VCRGGGDGEDGGGGWRGRGFTCVEPADDDALAASVPPLHAGPVVLAYCGQALDKQPTLATWLPLYNRYTPSPPRTEVNSVCSGTPATDRTKLGTGADATDGSANATDNCAASTRRRQHNEWQPPQPFPDAAATAWKKGGDANTVEYTAWKFQLRQWTQGSNLLITVNNGMCVRVPQH